ncbi:hypothetical protein QTP88_016498 [Uroleucon formosanum]
MLKDGLLLKKKVDVPRPASISKYNQSRIKYFGGLTAYSILIIFVSSCSHYYFVMEKTFLKKKVMGGAAKNRNAKKIKLQQVAQEAKTITSFFNKQTKPEPLDKLIEEQEYSVDYPDDHDRSVSLNIEQPVLFTNEDDTMDNMV